MRWSRAASTPSLIIRRRVGCPTSRQANGLRLSMSWLVSMRRDSSWPWSSRCASSMTRTGVRPRSACSVARASAAWGTRVAWWKRGTPPRAVTMWWWMPRTADGGVGEVDGRVAAGVERGQCGAQRHGFARADLTGDDAEGVLVDAPGDAGNGLGVAVVAVQHARGEVAAEGHAGESVEALQFADHRVSSSVWSWGWQSAMRASRLVLAAR